ncbi:MAG: hypothetical protein AAB362_02900 [Patescibacteria group bacterium]
MPDKIKKNEFSWLILLFVLCIVGGGIVYFNVHRPYELSADEVFTIGDESFFYIEAEKWTDRRGMTAILEAIAKFKKDHPDFCILNWHHETTSERGDDRLYGIWISHKPKLPKGC